MNIFVKYITKLIIGYLKRLWYYIKLERLVAQLSKEKKEAEDATKTASADYDEFSHMYAEYLNGKRSSDVRSGSSEVREDGGESEEGN